MHVSRRLVWAGVIMARSPSGHPRQRVIPAALFCLFWHALDIIGLAGIRSSIVMVVHHDPTRGSIARLRQAIRTAGSERPPASVSTPSYCWSPSSSLAMSFWSPSPLRSGAVGMSPRLVGWPSPYGNSSGVLPPHHTGPGQHQHRAGARVCILIVSPGGRRFRC